MAYQSLYRKYRPQNFADVMGQAHVTRTLQNALASGRIAHGYLFTGTRGTAKTTIARILAKALNCDSTDHAVPEPCNKCPACISITNGSAIDVIEMDAASHRGVADVEEVRKSVGYGPMELRYKVFIIDEAHQLSSDAKDAFLKTLEEPPDNVVFILATTEPQAIPITIRSRCQQFDFKRGSLSDIGTRLRFVLEAEKVEYSTEAINLIARGAEGSWRDSLSLLEQVLAFADARITADDVNTVLGSLDTEMLARVTQAVARRDAPTVFALAGELLDSGKEARTLLRTLSAHFRDLLLVSVGGPAVAAELTAEEVGRLQEEAGAFTPPQMMRAMDILNEAQGETRWNNQHRLLVELTFLKLMTLDGNDAAPGAPKSAFVTAPIVFSTAAAVPPVVVQKPVLPAPPPPIEAPVDTAGPEAIPATFFGDDALADPEDDYEPDAEVPAVEDDEAPLPTATPLLVDVDEHAPPEVLEDEGPGLFDDPLDVPTLTVVSAASLPAPSASAETIALIGEPEDEDAPDQAPFTLDDVNRVWPDFLGKAGSVSKMTETLMLQAHPTDVVRDTVEITFRVRSNMDMMNTPKKLEFVRKLLALCLGVKHVAVHFRLDEAMSAPAPPKRAPQRKKVERDDIAALDAFAPSARTPGPKADDVFGAIPAIAPSPPPRHESRPPARMPSPHHEWDDPDGAPSTPHTARQTAAMEDPLVQEVLSIFGGEVVDD